MATGHVGMYDDDLILAINPGHDGAIAVLQNGNLALSAEGEHDSHPRHMPANAYLMLYVATNLKRAPAVIATSGWVEGFPFQSASTTYYGITEQCVKIRQEAVFGRTTIMYESTHERSHVFCAYGLSPFPQGQPCYVLVWEGLIGSFYEIGSNLNIVQHGPVLNNPGYKYSFLFDLADPSCEMSGWQLDTAGKLMALAGLSSKSKPTTEEQIVIKRILNGVDPPTTSKRAFMDTPYHDCGVTNPRFVDLVAAFSDALFNIFYKYADAHLKKRYPLLIAGGCGLNCDWNSKWRDCGLFNGVFVPPVANDSGSAIGTAVEAQYVLSGRAKISWNVYSGPEFIWDGQQDGFVETDVDYDAIAELLMQEKVVAWVQGRAEIGPRALGNRSLLASPFHAATKQRLNAIKQREWYRPIAPVCVEEDARRLFCLEGSSPFMLYFQPTCDTELAAVTHVDGSARVQTVNSGQNAALYMLLAAFKRRTGYGVLCNTSLNRKGQGFINRSSDLFSFVLEKSIDAAVINGRSYTRAAAATNTSVLARTGTE